MIFNVKDWIVQQAKIKLEKLTIEDIEFELISLTDEQIQSINELTDYEEYLEFAALHGLAANGVRALDLDGMDEDKLSKLWVEESINLDTDPSICHQVGEKVIEMSGLSDDLETLKPEDEEVIDGDNISAADLSRDLQSFNSQSQPN